MEWLTYLLKVSACSALFFAFYLVVLRKLTFFRGNRFYLLFSLLLSFAIPALNIEIEKTLSPVEFQSNVQEIQSVPETQTIARAPVALPVATDWPLWLNRLYMAVAMALLALALRRVLLLMRHTNTYSRINGLKLIHKNEGFTNCSFFNYVFIDSKQLTAEEIRLLLKHEEVHAKQYHSFDKLLLLVAKAVLWFNPLLYFYDKELEQLHEYEADASTSTDFGTNPYANLLLKLAIQENSAPLVHSFVKSPIKERIKMLYQSKSTNMKKLNYVLVVPMLAALVWNMSVSEIYAYDRKAKTNIDGIGKRSTMKSISGRLIGYGEQKLSRYAKIETKDSIVRIEMPLATRKLINIGDLLRFEIGGMMSGVSYSITPEGKKTVYIGKAIYMPYKIFDKNGKTIYELKVERTAFLFEANRARYADTKIKAIQKNASGRIEKIKLNDGTFTIDLNVSNLNISATTFKAGDDVRVNFIGEKQISSKVYATDKLIALYPIDINEAKGTIHVDRSRKLINEALYNKFYEENGQQKMPKNYKPVPVVKETDTIRLTGS